MVEGRGPADVRVGLKGIVADYSARGVDLAADPRLAEAVLLDSFPESPAEVRGLVEAIRSGSIQHMRDRAGQGAQFSIEGSASQLAESAGLREDLARWVAETWWSALSLGGPSGDDSAPTVRGGGALPGGGSFAPEPPASRSPAPMTVTAGPQPAVPPSPTAVPPATVPPASTPTVAPGWTGAAAGQPPPSGPATVPPNATSPATQAPPPWASAPTQGDYAPNAPAYGAQQGAPAYGAQQGAPAYGAQQGAPAYGAQAGPPAYGTQQGAPAYGAQQGPPQYGGQGPPAWGAQQGSGGTPGAGSRRKFTAIGIAAVVIVYLLAAAGGHLPPFSKASSQATSTTRPPSSSIGSTVPTSVPTTLPSGTEKLLSVIPNSSNGTCRQLTTTQIATFAPGASAVEACVPESGEPQAEYALFSTSNEAETFYTAILDRVQSGGLPTGNCSDGNTVEGDYTAAGSTTSIGNVACYVTGGDQYLLWWHFSDNIVSSTDSPTLSLARLYRDWSSFGPS